MIRQQTTTVEDTEDKEQFFEGMGSKVIDRSLSLSPTPINDKGGDEEVKFSLNRSTFDETVNRRTIHLPIDFSGLDSNRLRTNQFCSVRSPSRVMDTERYSPSQQNYS